ncbi:hypothetical protein HMPREF9431_01113 [Segatella oulorum F0390]|uniref:Fimbrillin family protein n=1 Tax=Segatella oulorum F0390 TaxID=702438 RepID=G1WBB2_9BACT|nr:hypothetical protein [Segatella oulorum]EGV32105.1 hypothetical protein HMPREF9431_01113 [Segatella oulorum F0390]
MKIKNKLSNLAWRRLRSRGLLVAVGAAALLAAACADDDLATDKSNKHTGTALAFNVSDMQMDALAQNGAGQTRGLSMQPIPASYLAPRKIDATGSNPHDFCLIESTVEGLNPVKVDAKTRGTILTASTLGTFSSIGYRAASSAAASNPGTALLWFHGEKTNPDGTLVNRYDWDWPVNVYGRFYAVSPEATAANGITLSPSNYAQVPYVDFEVKSNVVDQVDLMTACSGEVHYEHGNDPTSNLKFTHALAAVKFSIGSNLSPVTIKKIEVSGVKYKGRYKLPNALNATGIWTSVNTATTTVTLDGINMNAAEMPNTMLAGALNPATNPNNRAGRDAYTFLMIPQTLPNKSDANHAKVTIYYEEGGSTKHISFPLTGEWKANTTREYKLSQKNSSWGYTFTLADENKAYDYQGNETSSNIAFKVTSYRQSGTTQQAVPWKISKYEEWDYTLNGGTGGWVDRGTTKPDWLGDLTDQGNGGTAAEVGNTAVKPATVIDKLAPYNQVLKDAMPKGSAGNPYNLANPGGSGAKSHIEETANCYLISAPGHYCIPLVYGNAIKNGIKNEHSYRTSNTSNEILTNFKDHAGVDINSPYINVQNASNPATKASIVWTDQSGLVDGLTVTGSGANSYVNFHVPADKIKNGNAVIAVKNASGIVMWSWHLWFDHSDVLNTIACTNYQGYTYNFTKQTLGFAYRKWEESTYSKPRMARMKVEQTSANGGTKQSAYVTITQNPRSVKEISSTLYQFGRKDAMPGIDAVSDGSFTPNGGDNMSIQNGIQHPEILYSDGTSWYYIPPTGYTYYNLWSMDNTTYGYNDNAVVKTIYDPCPAGFHMPASNAFTGFTTNGLSSGLMNVSGAWDYGWNFKAGGSSTATVYFPASGCRGSNGSLYYVGEYGIYLSAVPNSLHNDCHMYFYQTSISPQNYGYRSTGKSVRPVAEP